MADTIEELLNENLGKVQELLSASEQMHTDVTRLQTIGDKLEDQFDSSADGTLKNLQAFKTRLTELLQAVEEADEKTKSKMDDVLEATGKLTNEVDEVADSVDDGAEAIHRELTRYESEFSSRVDRQQDHFYELNSTLGNLADGLESKISNVRSAAETQSTKMIDGWNAMVSSSNTVLTTFTNFEQEMEAEINAIADDVGTKVENVQAKSDGLDAALKNSIGTALAGLLAGLNDDIPNQIQQLTSSTTDSFSSVSELFTSGCETGIGSIDNVVGDIDEISDVVQKIKPVLDLVDTLL
jgi:CHASE3 domain sensor protein